MIDGLSDVFREGVKGRADRLRAMVSSKRLRSFRARRVCLPSEGDAALLTMDWTAGTAGRGTRIVQRDQGEATAVYFFAKKVYV